MTETWACHVCGDERPDERIAVARYHFERGGVRMILAVRHCADREPCILGTLDVAEGWAHGWTRIREAVS